MHTLRFKTQLRLARLSSTVRGRKPAVRLASVLAALAAAVAAQATVVSAEQARVDSPYSLDVPSLAKLQQRLRRFDRPLPDPTLFSCERVVAYEEHPLFSYVVGRCGPVPARDQVPQLERRVWLLKPDVLVLADVSAQQAGITIVGSGANGQASGGQLRVWGDRPSFAGRVLLPASPRSFRIQSYSRTSGGQVQSRTEIHVADGHSSAGLRRLLVLRLSDSIEPPELPAAQLIETPSVYRLEVTNESGRFTLRLPKTGRDSGTIAVAASEKGKVLLDERPLAAGILPHGEQGISLLQRWDSAYAPGRSPPWDTGRPDSHLKKAVDSGALKPCRAIELGCGTGTNAVYLAGKGFDVTALDLAPRALVLAGQKAQRAGVRVRWLLANVLAPPEGLGQFDLIFDRGCYHGVRRTNAAGYVRTLRQLSHPGTLVFILAGNANERRHYGPPRVSEQELRADFSQDFQFRWLRTVRFDTRAQDDAGALGWCVLLERKEASKNRQSSKIGDRP